MTSSHWKADQVRRAGGFKAEFVASFFRVFGSDRLLKVASRYLVHGTLVLRLPDGREKRIKGRGSGIEGHLHLHNWRAARRFAVGGAVGFARAYIDGDWDSPDLAGFIELIASNKETIGNRMKPSLIARLANRLRHARRANTKQGSRRNIAFHYDLGNDFYDKWLDPSMTYSAAVFEGGENSLENAQKTKYRRLMDLMELNPGDNVLEIGCGWGGFAEMAAKERGAKVTGITLSQEQLSYAQARMQREGLNDLVHLELRDYRDVKGRFDRVASIEMFEAVGAEYWATYFAKIKDVLNPGGKAGLQIITIDELLYPSYRRSADFIQTYIFPGGMLPSLTALRDEVAAAGLTWQEANSYAQDYARTLGQWVERFNAAFESGRLPKGFDEKFRRIWHYYLAYCEGGFRARSIDVFQLKLSN